MSENKIQIVRSLLEQSIDLLYENDCYLITNSVHEQSISHRIAHYLENLLIKYDWFVKDGYSVDVEYNKNFGDSKKVFQNCSNCNQSGCYIKTSNYDIDNYKSICRPDIIIHKRESNDNILAIEIKKEELNNAKDKYDFAKLSAFSCDRTEYKYILGIFINVNESKYRYFKNGQEVNENAL